MQSLAPPTIADLRAERVSGLRVWCLNRACQHYGVVPFEAIGAPTSFTFIDLPKTRRFVCRKCGAMEAQVMPDWPDYRPWSERAPFWYRDIHQGRATKSVPALRCSMAAEIGEGLGEGQ